MDHKIIEANTFDEAVTAFLITLENIAKVGLTCIMDNDAAGLAALYRKAAEMFTEAAIMNESISGTDVFHA